MFKRFFLIFLILTTFALSAQAQLTVKEVITRTEQWAPAEKDFDEARKFIVEKYFYDDPEKITPEIQEQLMTARKEYVNGLKTVLFQQNKNLLKQYKTMLEGVAFAIETGFPGGEGEMLQRIDVSAEAVQKTITWLIIEIILQIQLLELETAGELLATPVAVLKEPKKEEEKK